MSLTPASTAAMAMKSALKASAISRARVVLPEPGGPQRIIECDLPDANATASVFGRSRSASGVAGFSTANRSLADDIGALRRRELEQIGGKLRITLEARQPDHAALAEVVGDLERGQS